MSLILLGVNSLVLVRMHLPCHHPVPRILIEFSQELFQGKTKGFDVEKALVAKSVREFEQAISMVSYGFDAIEDFYLKSSTRDLVGYVKIPVLFIQVIFFLSLFLQISFD